MLTNSIRKLYQKYEISPVTHLYVDKLYRKTYTADEEYIEVEVS